MNISYYEEILEQCFREYPFLQRGFVDYRPLDEFSIRITREDGSKCDYDSMTHTWCNAKEYNEIVTIARNITDDYCRTKFANNLGVWMSKKGYTQQTLARDTGISIGIINSYLYGRATPSITKCKKIACVLGCRLDDLLA